MKMKNIATGVARFIGNAAWLSYDSAKVWVCGKMGHKGLFYRDRTICTRCHITMSYAGD